MIGSEKQIKWAEEIKENMIEELKEAYTYILRRKGNKDDMPEIYYEIAKDIYERNLNNMLGINEAKFFIEKRSIDIRNCYLNKVSAEYKKRINI